MKGFGIIMWATALLSTSLFTGCGYGEHSEDYKQNLIFISNRWNEAKLHNGDVIPLEYYCEEPTTALVRIVGADNGYDFNTKLQSQNMKMKRGDGVLNIKLDVGDYLGMAKVSVTHLSEYEDIFLSLDDTVINTTREFYIEIVADEQTPEQEGDGEEKNENNENEEQ